MILCVDDDVTILNALKDMLTKNLGGTHSIEIAETGQEALDICQELKELGKEFCLVISDFIMPSMKGDELLVNIHAISPDAVKIMLTGQSSVEGVKRAINEANLYRFMEKPFDNSDMMLTVRSAIQSYEQSRELELRNRELEEINNHLEQLVQERTSELNQSLKIIRKDLQLAKKIQKSILTVNPELQKILNIQSAYIPMAEVGGDYFDICQIGESIYRFFLADATGHGVQAAMVTMAIKGIFDNVKTVISDPALVMQSFNNEYIEKYRSLNTYLTAIVIDLDVKEKSISYASAGHPSAVLLRQDGMHVLGHTGKMIGILKDAKFSSAKFEFHMGEKLVFYTDGIFEQFNEKREEYGEERLHSLFSQHLHLTLAELIQCCLNDLDQFLDGLEKQDDLTMLGVAFH